MLGALRILGARKPPPLGPRNPPPPGACIPGPPCPPRMCPWAMATPELARSSNPRLAGTISILIFVLFRESCLQEQRCREEAVPVRQLRTAPQHQKRRSEIRF